MPKKKVKTQAEVAEEVVPPAEPPPTAPEPKLGDEFVINCNFVVALGPPIFVVKGTAHNGKKYYARFTSNGKPLPVESKRLATRVDSRLWAQTLAAFVPGGSVVRLLNKAEREHKEMVKKGPTQYRFKTGIKEAFYAPKKPPQ